MSLQFPLFVAKRMWRSKDNTSRVSSLGVDIATVGVAVGMVVMILSVAIVSGFKAEIRNKVTGFGSGVQIVNSDASQTVAADGQMAANFPVVCSDKFFNNLSHTPGVTHVQRITQKAGIFKTDDDFKGIVFYGVGEDFDSTFISSHLQEGTMPRFKRDNSSNEVVISSTVAKELGLKVGDRVFAYFFDGDMRIRRFSVKGIYETNLSMFDTNVVYADIAVLNALNGWNSTDCSNVEIAVSDFNKIEETADRVADVLPNTPDSNGCFYAVYSIGELYSSIFDWLNLLDLNIWVILGLMTCVCCFTIISGLLILILEKTPAIGLLKALGARNKSVRNIYIYYGMYVIGKGVLLGNAVGLLLCFLQYQWHLVGLDSASYYVDFVPVTFNWSLLLLLNLALLLLGLLVLFLPTIVIAHVKPVKVLKFD